MFDCADTRRSTIEASTATAATAETAIDTTRPRGGPQRKPPPPSLGPACDARAAIEGAIPHHADPADEAQGSHSESTPHT